MFETKCKTRIAVVDKYTPEELIEKSTHQTEFAKLADLLALLLK